ncbi:MAG: HAMP domain-containing sensor histidine kinase, partial [Tenericutes bacterium]|nr:HAMP domain-containing sensor histidine kinase [Mycoplasmatota bacterium]
MNSTLRSKLFLLTYGTILAFIAGLLIVNNTILRNYYTYRKNETLVEAFEEMKVIDYLDVNSSNQLLRIESKYNISVHVVIQDKTIDPTLSYESLVNTQGVYQRLYGNPYSIYRTDIIRFIYHYNQYQQVDSDFDIAKSTDVVSGEYDGYYFSLDEEDNDIIGFFVAKPLEGEGYIFYFNTITARSINENIWIFNSFTVIVGMFFMVASGAVMYFISYRLTNPILEINRVANEIANLNFSDKIEVTSDDEIGHLAKSVNKMSDDLRDSIEELRISNERLGEEVLFKNQVEKKRRDFVASASHELKTPLSLIMGYSEALKLQDITEEDKQTYLDIIVDETHKMNKLVREMLNMSQIESGAITIKKSHFSINKLVNNTIKLFSIKLNEKEINLTIDIDDVEVYSDYDQLQTVLINFVNNAMNHIATPNQLSIFTKSEDDETIRLYVYNTGQNIPKEDIKNLWDSFYKVDKSRTREYGGHGLGLAICKTILETLDYSFGVENIDDGVA